jgi:hypothetical protein
MRGEFDGPGFAVLGPRHYFQANGRQLRLILRVDLVIAEELLDHFLASVNPLQQGAGLQPNAGNAAAELGIGSAALRHGAENWRNDDVLGLGIMLGAVSIGEFQQVAGTL